MSEDVASNDQLATTAFTEPAVVEQPAAAPSPGAVEDGSAAFSTEITTTHPIDSTDSLEIHEDGADGAAAPPLADAAIPPADTPAPLANSPAPEERARQEQRSKKAKAKQFDEPLSQPPAAVEDALPAASPPTQPDAPPAAPAAEAKATKKTKGKYAAPMRRVKIVNNGDSHAQATTMVLTHRDTVLEKIYIRVTKTLKLWKPCTALHKVGGEEVTDPSAFVNGEIYVATTGEEVKKIPTRAAKPAVKRKRAKKLPPTSKDAAPVSPKQGSLKTPPKVPPIGSRSSSLANVGSDKAGAAATGAAAATAEGSAVAIDKTPAATRKTKQTTSTRAKKAGSHGTRTLTSTTASKRSKGKSPMKSPRSERRAAAPSKAATSTATAAKRAEKIDKGAGAAVAKNTATLKRTAFRSLAMEIQLSHSDEAAAHVAWGEAVPGDGGMLGPLDFASFVAQKFPLLDNRSVLAIAFQQTVEMQAKESPLLSGKCRIGARFFAPLLLHAVYLAEAFVILGLKRWADFASVAKKLGPGRIMLKLGKGQDAKRAMSDADTVALLGLDELQAGSPSAIVIAACKWFADEATPNDWKWVEVAKHSNTVASSVDAAGDPLAATTSSRARDVDAAAGPQEPPPLPRRASAPIVAQTVLGDDSSELAVAITGGGEELNALWESFAHPASTKAKGKSLGRLSELISEKGGMSAAGSAVKYAYNIATGMQPSTKAALEQPAFQYATFSAMVLTDLATILCAASTKVYNADPIISLAEFKEGIAEYRALHGEELEAACATLDTAQAGVFPYSAVCKWYVEHRRQQWPNISVPDLPQPKSGARDVNAKPSAKAPAAKRKVSKAPAPKKPAGGRTSPARASMRATPKPVPKSNRKPSKQVVALTSNTKRKKVLIKKLTPSANTGIHALKETRDEDVAAAEVIQLVLTDPRQVLRLWDDIDNKVDGTATVMDIANVILKSYGMLKNRIGPHINSFFESLVKARKGVHPGFVDDPTGIPFTVIEMLHYARLAQCFDLPPPSANIDARIDAKIAHDSIAKLGAHKFLAAKEKAAFHSMPSKEGGDRGTVLLSDFCHWYAEERVRREAKLEVAKLGILDEIAARSNGKSTKRRFSLFKAKAKQVKDIVSAFGGPNAGKEIDGRLNFSTKIAV